jgi:excinuclease ABC subunit C
MIVSGADDGLIKSQYRKIQYQGQSPGDDFGMMKEVLMRTFNGC